jgi:glycerol-3-phosphate acyltransferase PlsX
LSTVIAVDVMGGDHAPQAPLLGVKRAASLFPGTQFLLFGPEELLEDFLKENPELLESCEVFHAPERVLNETPAREAVRSLKGSSMRLAIESVAEGRAQGVVSGGNTGAYMALSKILLKTLEDIDRPAIVGTLPTQKGSCVMLDLGANVEATPAQLCQFAQMGEAFSKYVLGTESPSVGLLNIGSEDLKGHATLKETQEMIRSQQVVSNFYGFVEGDDIMGGTTDVVVTDGFTGNVALKSMEGAVYFLLDAFKSHIKGSFLAKCGALLARGAFGGLRKRFDPRLHNGAPFLGLRGVAVKSHGGMDEVGFANALGVAINMIQHDLNDHILEEVRRVQGKLAQDIDSTLQSESGILD